MESPLSYRDLNVRTTSKKHHNECKLENKLTLENMLFGYVDDSSLIDVLPSKGLDGFDGDTTVSIHWIAIAESLNRDLGKISEWC